jgi:hypothetical protein
LIANRVLLRRLRPPEGTPLGSFPEPFAAYGAARQYLDNRYAIPTSSAGELTFRQGTSRPELHVFVVSGRPWRDSELRLLHVIPFPRVILDSEPQ